MEVGEAGGRGAGAGGQGASHKRMVGGAAVKSSGLCVNLLRERDATTKQE